jgi:hypothetical protein
MFETLRLWLGPVGLLVLNLGTFFSLWEYIAYQGTLRFSVATMSPVGRHCGNRRIEAIALPKANATFRMWPHMLCA